MSERRLDWDGCVHARDLGGLPTADGRTTRRHAVVRSGTVDGLSPAGWEALQSYGIRTIVDLRNDDERPATRPPHPPGIAVRHVPIDGSRGPRVLGSLWSTGPQFGTPLYYGPFLRAPPAAGGRRGARAIAHARLAACCFTAAAGATAPAW